MGRLTNMTFFSDADNLCKNHFREAAITLQLRTGHLHLWMWTIKIGKTDLCKKNHYCTIRLVLWTYPMFNWYCYSLPCFCCLCYVCLFLPCILVMSSLIVCCVCMFASLKSILYLHPPPNYQAGKFYLILTQFTWITFRKGLFCTAFPNHQMFCVGI